MKNHFPKIAITLAVALFIIPQVTFAAWWNPFTWGIFNKTDTKTEVLEKRIQELESKLGSNATTTIATSTPKEIATTTIAIPTPVVKKEIKKVTPVVDNSAIIQAQVKAQVEAQLKAKADQDALIAKQKADEQARLDSLKAEADRQAAQTAANLAAQQAAEQQAVQDALSAKQAQLNAVNQKIADLNAKYAADMKKCSTSGGTTGGVASCKSVMTDRYTDDYNALMAEFQQIKYSN